MTNGNHIRNVQMIGNAGLVRLPKTAFLSSRKVAPQDVMRCYDWATGMRGGGSAGRLAPPGAGDGKRILSARGHRCRNHGTVADVWSGKEEFVERHS
jgi:hypothetical protein